jgi:glutamine cyclotransferase
VRSARLIFLFTLFVGLLAAQPKQAPVFGYRVVNTYPHDRSAFTEGLFYLDGFLYESSGLERRSDIRRVRLDDGQVVQRQPLAAQYFGEGIAPVGNSVFQLTYKTGIVFVYDRATFRYQKQFQYTGEGWGMTTDGKRLIMSDGTHFLRFFDPTTFKETGRVAVTNGGRPIEELNELEFIHGEIYANIWKTERIARIDLQTGRVSSWIDLKGILSVMEARGTDVMNGIAYDAQRDRLFVTGKWWPRLFEIKVVPKQ